MTILPVGQKRTNDFFRLMEICGHPDRIHFRGFGRSGGISSAILESWIRVLPGLVARSLTHPITGSGRMRGLHRMTPRHPMNRKGWNCGIVA